MKLPLFAQLPVLSSLARAAVSSYESRSGYIAGDFARDMILSGIPDGISRESPSGVLTFFTQSAIFFILARIPLPRKK